MPRPPRIIFPEGFYHVYCRGNNRAALFHDDDDLRAYMDILHRYKRLMTFDIYHYALMTNHLHLMICPGTTCTLSDIMKNISHSYTRYYKRRYEFKGQLWEGRFKCRLIENDSDLQTCGIYIELNPVKAGMVKSAEDYEWSSYRSYGFGERHSLVTLDPTYLGLDDDEKVRQKIYRVLTKGWQFGRLENGKAGTFEDFGARHRRR